MGNLQEYTRNRLSKTVGPSSISTSYTYDKADELQTFGGTTYTVNADGNLTAAGSSSFGYDQANRLIGATVDGHVSSYTCDGDGKRASRTTHGVTTPYTWDVVGALPNVLSDGTLKYVYGLGLAYTMDGSNNIQVFQTDGLGSVRAITNSGGSVIQTFQTDEFGVPTLTQGTNTEPFRYSGQPRRALRHDPLAPNGFDGIFDVVDELALAEERAFNVVDVRLVSPGPR